LQFDGDRPIRRQVLQKMQKQNEPFQSPVNLRNPPDEKRKNERYFNEIEYFLK